MIIRDMIYLASPYSHKELGIRLRRFQLVAEISAKCIQRGHNVFSPIAYGHAMAKTIGTNFEVWAPFNDMMIQKSAQMWVLMLDGWKESRGIEYEVRLATKLDIPVSYMYLDGTFVQEST